MHPADAFCAEHGHCVFNPASDQVGCLGLIVLDVNDAEPESDGRFEIAEYLQLVITAASELENKVIAVEGVEER
jgi:hypothetical protein